MSDSSLVGSAFSAFTLLIDTLWAMQRSLGCQVDALPIVINLANE
jgi:hypothetical protein